MTKISLVTATLIFIFGLVSIGFAFQNEPEGFGELKWGDPPTEDMRFLFKEKTGITVYTSEKGLFLGGVPLCSPSCFFYNQRFYLVIFSFKNKDDFYSLQTACKNRFGKPTWESPFGEEPLKEDYDLFWDGSKACVQLRYSNRAESGLLSISNKKINAEVRKAEEREAKHIELKTKYRKLREWGEQHFLVGIILFWFIAWFIVAFIMAADAGKRGMSKLGWWLATFLLGLIGLIVYLCVRKPYKTGNGEA